jgi:hypothetical protein
MSGHSAHLGYFLPARPDASKYLITSRRDDADCISQHEMIGQVSRIQVGSIEEA